MSHPSEFKMMRVDLSARTIKISPLPDKYVPLGGRVMIAEAIFDEIDPKCDPLGEGNKLILAAGTLAASGAPVSGGRLSVGAKSPLTGSVKEASAGGNFASHLASHGIKLVIIEGKSDTLCMMHIDAGGNCTFVDAENHRETLNYPLVEEIQAKHGGDCAVMCCGPAGVRRYSTACIMVTDFTLKTPSRAAGRGGLGAVMGSKGLRAIVLEKAEKPFRVEPADKALFQQGVKQLTQFLMQSPTTCFRKKVGTSGVLSPNEQNGILPVKNFRSQPFSEIVNLQSEAFVKRSEEYGGKVGLPCSPGCVVRCSQDIHDKAGKHLTSGLQYETLALCGSNCLISNLDHVAQISRYCDDFGIDTIEFGAAIGVMMEAGKLEWGDGTAVLSLMQHILSEDDEQSRTICCGLRPLGKALGTNRLPEAKGQAFPAYDPRVAKGMQMNYQISPMGADHTYGTSSADENGDWTTKTLNSYSDVAVRESMFCWFPVLALGRAEGNGNDIVENIVRGFFGPEWTHDKIRALGRRAIRLEAEFDHLVGHGVEKLADFLFEEDSVIAGERCKISQETIAHVHAAQRGE